ncbi:MAG: hypothetical protein ABI580_06140 [Burkholderiaceae bacterium]
MSTAIRVFVVAAMAALLAYLTWPWLKNALYLGALLAEEPPRTLPVPVPVPGVSMRAVRDTFGAPRPGDRKHHGIDIFAPRGTPPHLHYGVYRRASGAINPRLLLTDTLAARAESVARKRAPGADRGAE